MQLSSPLFVVLFIVVGTTVWSAAEPCVPAHTDDNDKFGYGRYDMPACDFCAHRGHGHGQCCDSIYRNSLGRNDDTMFDDEVPGSDCFSIGEECKVGEGACFPGLGLSGNLYVTHR